MRVQQFRVNPETHDLLLTIHWLTMAEVTQVLRSEDAPPMVHMATWVKRLASDNKRRAARVEALMKAGGCQPCVRKVLDEAIDSWWVQGAEAVEVAFAMDTVNWHLPTACPGYKAPVLTNAKDSMPDTKRLVMEFYRDFAIEVTEITS